MISCNQEKQHNNFIDVKIISFDAGFTLLEPNPCFGGILAKQALTLGYKCDPEILTERLFKAHHKYVEISRERGKSMYACQKQSKTYWDKITIDTYGEFVKSKDAQELANNCYVELAKGRAWRPFDDVLSILKELSARGYKLIVLSNWDNRLPDVLKDLGLADFFEKIYCSTHIGAEKPDPDFFQYVLNDLKVHPSSILHIGDNPVDDLQGASNMGMKGAVIKRSVTISPLNPTKTDFTVNSLDELLHYFPQSQEIHEIADAIE